MIRLPKLFGNGCVLQQGSRCRIWGWSAPHEELWLSLELQEDARQDSVVENQKLACAGNAACSERTNADTAGMEGVPCGAQAEADADGCFVFELQTPPAGGPYLMRVETSHGEKSVIREVYVGEVFVCSGQSNMELPMSRVCERFPEEFRDGGAPDVHEYKVTEYRDFRGPLADHVQAEWRSCTGEKLPEISAFVYFFGKELARVKKVPVGILNLSLGGTPAEAWMSREGLRAWPEALREAELYRDDDFCRRLTEREAQEESDWQREIVRQEQMSADAPWLPAKLPGQLRDWGLEDFCGCVYLRKKFCVPAGYRDKDGLLRFGTLVDSDTIYINGTCVGETGYRYPPRRYPVPTGLLREGENEILIRLVCRTGEGRSTDGQSLEIVWENDSASCGLPSDDPTGRLCRMALAKREGRLTRVSLAGEWEYQQRAVCGPAPGQTFISWKPTGLFHGMLAPCLPYRVRGVLWYQGESNDSRPQTYNTVLEGLIRDWRSCWRQEKLPFVVMQLPNCGVDVAPDDAWPQIREAQYMAGRLEDTAVTVNLDAGEDNDLHPRDKKTVALRAVSAVRARIYGEDVAWRAPGVCGWEVLECAGEEAMENGREEDCCGRKEQGKEGGRPGRACVRLRFDGPVVLRRRPEGQDAPDNPRLFELAAADGSYHPASAHVEGEYVILQSGETACPAYVRYAWFRAPGATLLYGGNGFCVSPFRLCLEKESCN